MKRAFYLTFGFLAVLIGFAILAWLFYNLFIKRQPQFTGISSLGQLFLPFVMVGCGIYWLRKGLKSSDTNTDVLSKVSLRGMKWRSNLVFTEIDCHAPAGRSQ
jgi:hypothetical protein